MKSSTVLRSILAITLVVTPAAAAAQILPDPAPELAHLHWLVGDWEGSGWMQGPDGRRSEFEGTERVEPRMDGRVIVVEGAFTADLGPNMGRVPVHQALGVFSHQRGKGVRFSTWTARGGAGEAHAAEVSEGRIVWGYDDPRQGRVRYTITHTSDGEWLEIGETLRDGAPPEQFFEMRLRRLSVPR